MGLTEEQKKEWESIISSPKVINDTFEEYPIASDQLTQFSFYHAKKKTIFLSKLLVLPWLFVLFYVLSTHLGDSIFIPLALAIVLTPILIGLSWIIFYLIASRIGKSLVYRFYPTHIIGVIKQAETSTNNALLVERFGKIYDVNLKIPLDQLKSVVLKKELTLTTSRNHIYKLPIHFNNLEIIIERLNKLAIH